MTSEQKSNTSAKDNKGQKVSPPKQHPASGEKAGQHGSHSSDGKQQADKR